jgi:hypothetical protein
MQYLDLKARNNKDVFHHEMLWEPYNHIRKKLITHPHSYVLVIVTSR